MERTDHFWEEVVDGKFYQPPPSSMELHVPCRDPIDHFLSYCNWHRYQFDCDNPDLEQEVSKCISAHNAARFTPHLLTNDKLDVKCFNPIPVEPYVQYMDTILQSKRVPSNYVPRWSNQPRDKDKECLLHDPALQQRVLQIMLSHEHGFFYQWCQSCMGSDKELPLSTL
jgi:hypothetical protein